MTIEAWLGLRTGTGQVVKNLKCVRQGEIYILVATVLAKTPGRSPRQLDETRQRIEKFYNYSSQLKKFKK